MSYPVIIHIPVIIRDIPILIRDIRDIRNIHQKITTDMLQCIIAYVDDDDLLELLHTDQTFFQAVRKTKRPVFRNMCHACLHSKHCQCKIRAKCVGLVYFLFLMSLIALCFIYVVYRKT